MKKSIYTLVLFSALASLSSCVKNVCDNSCAYAYDGTCDDGGSGSSWSVCDCGTDCYDCGDRKQTKGPGGITQSCK